MVVFPVPRHELPTVEVTADERRARKAQMQRMLDALVSDYERFTEGSSRQVDLRRWKPSTSRGKLKLFKERNAFDHNGMDSNAIAEFRHDSITSFSEEKADAMRMTLMVGECPGRMENAMYATIAPTQVELSLVDIFLHEDVADCAVLNVMEGPHADDPYYFLGYKWFVRKSPTTASLVNHRDSVYVEYSGMTKTSSGDELGYHIMHSVDLPSFPEMRDRNCLRSSQSIRALYHQKPGNVVEVFIMGNVDVGGMLKGPIASVFIQETLFNMPKLIDCGEAKRLTKMLRDSRTLRDQRAGAKQHSGEACALCRQPKKLFSASILECDICGLDVCGKCRMTKRVYQHEGILGRFYKVACCKTCVLAAKTPKPFESTLVPVVPVSKVVSASAKSVRSVVEHLERRHRADSHSASGSSTDTNSYSVTPIQPPSHISPPPVPLYIGSVASSREDSIDTSSVSSPYSLAEVAPLVHAAPVAASAVLQTPAEMYKKMQELQQMARAAYITTKQNQRFIDGQTKL